MKDALSVKMKPDWEEIARTSAQAQKFLSSHRVPPQLVEALYMVICELLENSLKYGVYSGEGVAVSLSIRVTESQVIVEVVNPFDDSCRPHLETLDRMIQWIRGYQDPFEAYVEKLREVSRRPLADETSGLGLARIAYEGGAILDFYVDDRNQLNVSAVSALD